MGSIGQKGRDSADLGLGYSYIDIGDEDGEGERGQCYDLVLFADDPFLLLLVQISSQD